MTIINLVNNLCFLIRKLLPWLKLINSILNTAVDAWSDSGLGQAGRAVIQLVVGHDQELAGWACYNVNEIHQESHQTQSHSLGTSNLPTAAWPETFCCTTFISDTTSQTLQNGHHYIVIRLFKSTSETTLHRWKLNDGILMTQCQLFNLGSRRQLGDVGESFKQGFKQFPNLVNQANSTFMSFTTLKNASLSHLNVLTTKCVLNPQIIQKCQEWVNSQKFRKSFSKKRF